MIPQSLNMLVHFFNSYFQPNDIQTIIVQKCSPLIRDCIKNSSPSAPGFRDQKKRVISGIQLCSAHQDGSIETDHCSLVCSGTPDFMIGHDTTPDHSSPNSGR